MAPPNPILEEEQADDQDKGSDVSALRAAVDKDASLKVQALRSLQRRNSFADLQPTSEQYDYTRVHIDQPSGADAGFDADTIKACTMLDKAMSMRKRWQAYMVIADPEEAAQARLDSPVNSPRKGGFQGTPLEPRRQRKRSPEFNPFALPCPPASNHTFRAVDGVYEVSTNSPSNAAASKFNVPSVSEFYRDMAFLTQVTSPGSVTTYSYKRLQVLEERFNLHVMLNNEREQAVQKQVPHRDFYNVRKVDTHVHHSACMNQKHLLRFIKSKLKKDPNEIVAFRDGRFMTLAEVFASLHLTSYDLSVDTLDMHADNTFHRFDRFNLKYNPAGQSRLREIFIKTDNLLAGQYLAEITREVISDMEASKYQLAEWRVSIYGRKLSEWDKLARWFYVHRLAHPCVRWLIQIPRLYHIYRKMGEITSFNDMVNNIFAPLFEVTRDPASNPQLHAFLGTVVGFDCVDDESIAPPEAFDQPHQQPPTPAEWTHTANPPYSYWMYYLYANLAALNQLRTERGMNTFEFRPHSGEAGDVDHLTSCFLVANKINHGIQLRKAPGLQYLYYLAQIGIAMSPLSNNKLFLDYNRNPFRKYFAQGLNVSLSTDDPLQLHVTKEPLMEEYSVAAQVWKLSSVDQCEIARNSVLQSGLEYRFKRHFLGRHFQLKGAQGNDIRQTNVPSIRLEYRLDQLLEEMAMIRDAVNAAANKQGTRK